VIRENVPLNQALPYGGEIIEEDNMKKFSSVFALILALSMAFVFAGCSDGGGSTPPTPPTPPVEFPTIPDTTKLNIGGTEGDEWSGINDYLGATPSKYFIIASVGGGDDDGYNAGGFGGIQIQFQGDGKQGDEQIKTTGDWSGINHSETEIVYLVFDLSQWDNYTALCTASWAQIRVNYGLACLGTFQGYIVDGSVASLTKPTGAVDFSGPDSSGHAKAPGYFTTTLPTQLQ